ncbi:Pepco domain-containing protein [Actinomadura meridiana]
MGLFSGGDGQAALRHVPIDILRENLRRTTDSLRSVLSGLTTGEDGLRLKEAHLGVEISSEGGIQLIGTAKVGAKANIVLVFGD